MTQCERILRHLNDYGSITSLEARRMIPYSVIASRISDLRGLGYPIEREFETAKNRYNEKVTYCRYRMGAQ